MVEDKERWGADGAGGRTALAGGGCLAIPPKGDKNRLRNCKEMIVDDCYKSGFSILLCVV